MLPAYLLLLVAIALGVAGQLSLKHGMRRQSNFQLQNLLSLANEAYIVFGFGLYGVSTLLYFKVLASLDLSLAYPTVSLGYVLVIIFSKILFDEPVSRARWGAVFLICFGVALVGFGAI